ncbi:transposase [Bacteroidales bacterium]
MAYHPNIHHRKSIRLKGYDYSQADLYFITICVQDRECLFGNIENGEMILNDAGQMVEKWYYELGNKYPDIKCHEMMVMPNHFHCIVENIGIVGADLRVCPDNAGEPQISGEHIGSPLHRVIQWLKTMSTNEYIRGVKQLGWQPFNGKLWQRNYWEHIIRNEQSYQRISEYIINNPKNWNNDKLYNK